LAGGQGRRACGEDTGEQEQTRSDDDGGRKDKSASKDGGRWRSRRQTVSRSKVRGQSLRLKAGSAAAGGQWAQSALESELEAGACACADQGRQGGLLDPVTRRDMDGMGWDGMGWGLHVPRWRLHCWKAAWASGSFAPCACSKCVGRGATTYACANFLARG